jgi:hypothetical protein
MPDAPSFRVGGLVLIGVANANWKMDMSHQIRRPVPDGSDAYELTVRRACLMNNYETPKIGDKWRRAAIYYLDRHDNIEDRGGLRMFDWVGYTMPKQQRIKYLQFKGNRMNRLQQNRPVYFVPKTYSGTMLIDIQIASYTESTWIMEVVQYGRADTADHGLQLPPNGPAGVVVHFINGVAIPLFVNGFSFESGTMWGQFVQSWSRKPWHADIWEQSIFIH